MKIKIKKKTEEGVYIAINNKTVWINEDSESELVISAWNTETNEQSVIHTIPHYVQTPHLK